MTLLESQTGELKFDIDDRKWVEKLLTGENRLLEMIAKGNSLDVILDGLCRLVEEISSGSLASILLLDPDGKRLWHGAAPSLPKGYTERIDGAVIGPSAGSCGTAAYCREPVIVCDIASDPLWADYRELASPHGLRACWSTPIFSTDGNVLGTFAIYSREVSSPTPEHFKLIEQITHLAAVAIERNRAEEKLRQSETELRQLIDAVPHHIFVLGPDGSRLYSNHVAREYHGLRPEDPQEDRPAMFVHPEDRERVLTERQRLIARGEPYEMEARLLGKDGQYRWFLIRGNRCGMKRDASSDGTARGPTSKTASARKRNYVRTKESCGGSLTLFHRPSAFWRRMERLSMQMSSCSTTQVLAWKT